MSHYRLSLTPDLQLLARRRQRRVHLGLAAPALIAGLLEEHGIEACAYRFDRIVGVYPTATRVQYDETDLDFLQRVCEEEGIHFRFEHSRNRHVLVFGDDPAGFPEQAPPLQFDPQGDLHPGAGTLWHLAQHWSMAAAPLQPHAGWLDFSLPPAPRPNDASLGRASNQPFDEPAAAPAADLAHSVQRQRSIRELERLRCERRRVEGISNRSDVHSGRIVHVLGHPDALLNDHWLITRTRHAGRQLEVLEGFDPHDVAGILGGDLAEAAWRNGFEPAQRYHNTFDAVPWTTAYRPALTRMRPMVSGEQPATVVAGDPDDQGRLPIRFDWQPGNQTGPHAHVLRGGDTRLDSLRTGARVLVAHLDADPDRPVICERLPQPHDGAGMQVYLNGQGVDAAQASVEAQAGQSLHVQAERRVRLLGQTAAVELKASCITLHGLHAVHAWPKPPGSAPTLTRPDLRLTRKPGLQGDAIAHCAWYIVRMAQPGLEHLPRLDPEHILFEGITDGHGYLCLSAQQLDHLAALYAAEPHALCLVYPGHCLTLHAWFQQNWTEQQRQAFKLSGP